MTEEIIEKEEVLEIEETHGIEEIPARKNPICVISKFTWDNGGHDIQTNSSWPGNPYGEDYAVVPDDMVEAILETVGFCDITLNDDGTEVISFVAREIPEPEPEPEAEPSTEEILNALLGVE